MSTAALTAAEDWELDFYSRPILEADGRKRWELADHLHPRRNWRCRSTISLRQGVPLW